MRPRPTLAAFPLAFLALLGGSAVGAGAPAAGASRPETPTPTDRRPDVSGRGAGPKSWGGIRAWFGEHGLTFACIPEPKPSGPGIGGAADVFAPAALSLVLDTSAAHGSSSHAPDAGCRGCLDLLVGSFTWPDLDEQTGGRPRSFESGIFAAPLALNFASVDSAAEHQPHGADGFSPETHGEGAMADALGLETDF